MQKCKTNISDSGSLIVGGRKGVCVCMSGEERAVRDLSKVIHDTGLEMADWMRLQFQLHLPLIPINHPVSTERSLC